MSTTAQPPQDFTTINKYAIKKGATGHTSNKDFRKNIDIRKKVKVGEINKKIILPDDEFAYGLPNPPHEDIADLIYNTYGNRAEEQIKKEYALLRKAKYIEDQKLFQDSLVLKLKK